MPDYDKFMATLFQIGAFGLGGSWLLKKLVGDKLDSINATLEKLTDKMGNVEVKVAEIEVKQQYHERWLEELQDEISGKTKVQ